MAWIALTRRTRVVDGVVTDVDPQDHHRAIWNSQNPEKRVDAIVSRMTSTRAWIARRRRGFIEGAPATKTEGVDLRS